MDAEILHFRLDGPSVLDFAWRDYDLAPDFPRLLNFLDYW